MRTVLTGASEVVGGGGSPSWAWLASDIWMSALSFLL